MNRDEPVMTLTWAPLTGVPVKIPRNYQQIVNPQGEPIEKFYTKMVIPMKYKEEVTARLLLTGLVREQARVGGDLWGLRVIRGPYLYVVKINMANTLVGPEHPSLCLFPDALKHIHNKLERRAHDSAQI